MRKLIAAAVLLAAASPAAAADLGNGVTLAGTATLVSDYRFRGISLSGEDPAAQGSLELGHDSGFYAGVWGSSLEDTALYGEAELDLYAGWRREVASGTTVDLGFTYYWYPDGTGASDVFEPKVAVTQALGPVSATVGAAWAPEQASVGGEDNLYLWAGLSGAIPGTPLTLKGQVGRSEGGFAPTGDYLDWSLGAEVAWGPAKLGLAYVDTDLGDFPIVDAGVVLSLSVGF
jgi:uncharacterized protein (TIGR02001 family)